MSGLRYFPYLLHPHYHHSRQSEKDLSLLPCFTYHRTHARCQHAYLKETISANLPSFMKGTYNAKAEKLYGSETPFPYQLQWHEVLTPTLTSGIPIRLGRHHNTIGKHPNSLKGWILPPNNVKFQTTKFAKSTVSYMWISVLGSITYKG